MKIAATHERNPAIGWDIDTTVAADGHEAIRHVRIDVNGSPIADEDVPGVSSWHKLHVQKGQFPGENHLIVTVLDGDGNETSAIDEWQ